MTLRLVRGRLLSPLLLALLTLASLEHICGHAHAHAAVEPAPHDPFERESNHGDACDATVSPVSRETGAGHFVAAPATGFVAAPSGADARPVWFHPARVALAIDLRPLFLLHASFLI